MISSLLTEFDPTHPSVTFCDTSRETIESVFLRPMRQSRDEWETILSTLEEEYSSDLETIDVVKSYIQGLTMQIAACERRLNTQERINA